jgi:hypothetical protein
MQMTTETIKQAADSHLSHVKEILSAAAMEKLKGNDLFDPIVIEQLKRSYEESLELLRTVSPLNEDGEIEYGDDM